VIATAPMIASKDLRARMILFLLVGWEMSWIGFVLAPARCYRKTSSVFQKTNPAAAGFVFVAWLVIRSTSR
jgi:hypothetical protein